ncbi:MAG TPA: iron ABC transporter permease [Anaerolineales bacterium]|nr:iron ABC transporter permease [Anaerolineales bacterium]HMV97366.1 iron ABC transporter permease [Anaerolineales bacterium]HMX19759.1 iron ABC transporter permease [Anaerolineales bacterium]HMX75123.1 iron ABC transporter permease [Anaerolineales bacterium]HMZ43852.1 iron ABC transporter permease [Anaerolineales bacterium]
MRRPFLFSFLFLLAALTLSLAVGSVFISPEELWRVISGTTTNETFRTILIDIRLPRTVLIALVGAALAGSGAAYQGLFRNPLADPYLIGVASGAGLGAVLAMSVKWPYTTLGLLAVPLAAFLASLLTVYLVYIFANVGGTVPTTSLILAGVAFSSFATSLTSFLMLKSTNELRRAIGWLLGGVSLAGWDVILALIPYLAIGLTTLILNGYALNLLQFGDDQAIQMGLNVRRVKVVIIVAASLVTAAAVSFAGIIGFVGLIVPHVVRIWWGVDYRRILPLSVVGGAGTLLLADVLARVILAPQELPLGIVTALAGAPFFLWVLRRAKNQGIW